MNTILDDIRTLCRDITQCNKRIQNVSYIQDNLFGFYDTISPTVFLSDIDNINKELAKITVRFESLSAVYIGINGRADNLENHNILNMLDNRFRALGESISAAGHYNEIISELK